MTKTFAPGKTAMLKIASIQAQVQMVGYISLAEPTKVSGLPPDPYAKRSGHPF